MRELIIERIKDQGWDDYSFSRGDNDAKSFSCYKDWLGSLSDQDLLDALLRVEEAKNSDYYDSRLDFSDDE